MLRAKAYGPDGGLAHDELTRLRELEGWGDDSGVLREVVEAPAADPIPEGVDPIPEPVDSIPEPVEGSHAAPVTRRRRGAILTGAAVTILAIGLGIGWGIWGWDRQSSALAAEHSDTQAELEAEHVYDAGTVTPLAEKHGVVVWRADRSEGEEVCVILTGAERPQHGCVTSAQLADSMWPNASATVPDGDKKAGQQLMAGLILSTNGELMPYIQVWDQSQSGWESQYTESELTQLRAVEAAGHIGSALSVLGYDGDSIIWSTTETGVLCAIVPTGDDGFAEACAEDSEESFDLVIPGDGVSTRYTITQPGRRMPQLTVYKDVDMEYYFGTGDDTEQ